MNSQLYAAQGPPEGYSAVGSWRPTRERHSAVGYKGYQKTHGCRLLKGYREMLSCRLFKG